MQLLTLHSYPRPSGGQRGLRSSESGQQLAANIQPSLSDGFPSEQMSYHKLSCIYPSVPSKFCTQEAKTKPRNDYLQASNSVM